MLILLDRAKKSSYDDCMERGTVEFLNQELQVLHTWATDHGCQKSDLLTKLLPVAGADPDTVHTVLLSEDDAEVLLDCLPAPSEITQETLKQARIKIQDFLSYYRFGDAQES